MCQAQGSTSRALSSVLISGTQAAPIVSIFPQCLRSQLRELMLLSNCGIELKPRLFSQIHVLSAASLHWKINYGPQMVKETVPLSLYLKCHLPSLVQRMFLPHVNDWRPWQGTGPRCVAIRQAARTGFWKSLRFWPDLAPKSAECVPPDLPSPPGRSQPVFLWKDQTSKVLRVSRACVTHCSSKRILHWIEFPPSFMQELCPVHEHTPRVINIKKQVFSFVFFPCCPGVIRVSETRQVNILHGSPQFCGLLWAGCARAGWRLLCWGRRNAFVQAGGWGKVHGQVTGKQHSCLGQRQGSGGPQPEKPRPGRGGARVLGGRAAAAVFGFPWSQDLDGKACLLIGEIGKGGRGSRIILCLYVFLSKHLLSTTVDPASWWMLSCIIRSNPRDSPAVRVSFQQGGDQSSERLSNLPKVTQLVKWVKRARSPRSPELFQ